MNKKGFSSIEYQIIMLLIEAFAVGIIPNLGVVSNVEPSYFISETQNIMDASKTEFVSLALSSPLENVFFESNSDNSLDTYFTETNYYVKMDRNGNFTDIVVWDNNFCYEAVLGTDTDKDGNIDINYLAKPRQFDYIDKTSIKDTDILKHHEDDSKENYCMSSEYVK